VSINAVVLGIGRRGRDDSGAPPMRAGIGNERTMDRAGWTAAPPQCVRQNALWREVRNNNAGTYLEAYLSGSCEVKCR
jgi:hypothetical protein